MNNVILFVASAGIREAFGVTAVVTTLVGIWLQWKRQSHLSEIEESVKNGTMPAEAARRRIRWVDWRASVLVITGIGMLLGAAVGLVD